MRSSCELAEEQRANYQTLMRREEAKSTWTDQQLLYISQLHLFTVMTLTGKVQIVEKEGDKQVVVKETKPSQSGKLHRYRAPAGQDADRCLHQCRAHAACQGCGACQGRHAEEVGLRRRTGVAGH